MFFNYLAVIFFAILAVNGAALNSTILESAQVQRRQDECALKGPISCFDDQFAVTNIGDCRLLLQDLRAQPQRTTSEGFFGHGNCFISWDRSLLDRSPVHVDFVEPLVMMLETCPFEDRDQFAHIGHINLVNGGCTTVCLSSDPRACHA